jgi:wobble nucleotide-excising tRNase
MSEVAKFINEINYVQETKDIAILNEKSGQLKEEEEELANRIKTLLETRRVKEATAKDETKGAELVNKYLSHYFGHQELKLDASDSDNIVKFKIVRNGTDAKNLSEGECSLISFCYFIAKMDDELSDPARTKQLIIYIDDPISSLDSNHVFFVFSLIENVLTKSKRYKQLFISTHNLNFYKYLKKLSKPDGFQLTRTVKMISGTQHFLIERSGNGTTRMGLTPNYLRLYTTEFNYLFQQVYECSILDETQNDHHYIYNFGNNLRKFLESYLFYKYPNHNLRLDKKLAMFFPSDSVSDTLINRVMNEYSHLEEHVDRGLEPIDAKEIKQIARLVVNRIQEVDPDQFQALLDSISPETED